MIDERCTVWLIDMKKTKWDASSYTIRGDKNYEMGRPDTDENYTQHTYYCLLFVYVYNACFCILNFSFRNHTIQYKTANQAKTLFT